MDFKVSAAAILLSVAAMTAVGGGVLYRNRDLLMEGTQTSAKTKSQPQQPEAQTMQEPKDLSAFMNDDTFFDRDIPGFLSDEEGQSQETSLSLIATSVQKDMRVQVVNGLGELIKGQIFQITLKEAGEYRDVDKDGVIYIGDLKPGEYQVVLASVPGYQVSREPIRVNVKETLEYTVMEDIDLLIKTESQVNAESEDTQVQEAEGDADDTEIKVSKKSDGKMRFGIDVSKYNKEIDWKAVKKDGVDFAIIRLGYRGSKTGALVEDPYFRKNVEGALENGISVGIYFFTQAVTEIEAVEEASMVLSLCREYQIEYPIFIDTEGAGGSGRADLLPKEMRTAVCKAFCETIESAGHIGGIYASRNWFNHNLETSELSDYVTWLAEYRAEPQYTGKYEMWQYTSSGSVGGIEGRVDLNISYLGY